MDETAPTESVKRRRARSPNYPGIDLARAVERAKHLYEKERKNPAAVNVILKHWGYGPKSGAGLVTLAALKHFGLLIDEGQGVTRHARLSDLALRIVQDTRPTSPERDDALHQAALAPTIHRELWDSYKGELPSDENLRFKLVNSRGFTESGASEFIQQFRTTLEFAGVRPGEVAPQHEEADSLHSVEAPDPPLDPTGHAGTNANRVTPRAINLPLSPNVWATIHLPAEISEREWDQLMALLNAMKPGLVARSEE